MDVVIEKMKGNIQESFDHIRKALDFREKLLSRQVDVLGASQWTTNEIQFIPENEVNLLQLIRMFGKFNVNKFNVSSDFLSNEDYEEDPVLMYKQLIQTAVAVDPSSPSPPENENNNKMTKELSLIDENANHLNESLINLILCESKELVDKSSAKFKGHSKQRGGGEKKGGGPPTNTKEGRHGNKKSHSNSGGDTPATTTTTSTTLAPKSTKTNSSTSSSSRSQPATKGIVVNGGGGETTKVGTITHSTSNGSGGLNKGTSEEAAATTTTTTATSTNHSKKKFSSLKNISNLTLTGSLNLRNITNLTINTNCNTRPTAINSAATPEYDVQAVACDFYNRLINENKLLSNRGGGKCCKATIAKGGHCRAVESSTSSGNDTSTTSFKEFSSGMERKLLEKMDNWTNVNVGGSVDGNGNPLLASNNAPASAERPKQIQHWLKQIINEPELEPMQNTELLEFSRIKSNA